MSAEELPLLTGVFPDIIKMKKDELLAECTMWRHIWGWIPSDIKYYVGRTGSQVGVQIRNYHRYLGVLLDTKWELKEIELGVWEKVYDQNDGQYFYERKIVKMPVGQIVSFDWIKERLTEEEMLAETSEGEEAESDEDEEQDITL